MKTRRTTLIMLLFGLLFSFPMEQAFAANIKTGRSRIKERRNGLYHMTTQFTGGTKNSTVKVEIYRLDEKSPKPLISSFTLKVTGKEKNGNFIAEKEFACLKGKDCLFRKDDNPIGESYKLSMTLLNKNGKPIGKTTTLKVVVELDESDCKNKHTLHNFSISGFDFYAPYSKENNREFPLLIKGKNSNGNTISVDVAFKRQPAVWFFPGSTRLKIRTKSSSSSKITETTITPSYDKEKQVLTVKWPEMDSVLIIQMTITTTVCGKEYNTKEVNFNKIESIQGDAIYFKLRKRKETSYEDGNEENTSNDSMKLNNNIKSSSSIQGSFQIIKLEGVQITNKGEVVTDLDVEAIVSVKDCKGKTSNIVIDLKYNEKTGSYANSKALALCNKTGMEVTCFSINAYSAGTSKKEKLKDWGPFCGTTDHF